MSERLSEAELARAEELCKPVADLAAAGEKPIDYLYEIHTTLLPKLVAEVRGLRQALEAGTEGRKDECEIAMLKRLVAEADKRLCKCETLPAGSVCFWCTDKAIWNRVHSLEALEQKKSVGHGDACFYCGQRCNEFAADPDQWPIRLCHADNPGVPQAHHMGCVIARLERTAAAEKRVRELEGVVDILIGIAQRYRDAVADAEGENVANAEFGHAFRIARAALAKPQAEPNP